MRVRTLAHEADPTISDSRIREAARIRSQWFRHALRRVPGENIDAVKHLRSAGLRLGLISNADGKLPRGQSLRLRGYLRWKYFRVRSVGLSLNQPFSTDVLTL